MSFDFQNFNPAGVVQSFEPLPSGWYRARITGQGMKATRAGNGHYLNLEWKILGTFGNDRNDPPESNAGRVVFERLNLSNPNQETVEIAREKLARIMNALKLERLDHGAESLLGGECLIKLTLMPAQGEYEADNSVKGYRPPERTQQLPLDGFAASPAPGSRTAPHLQEDPPTRFF
jgi:hypothetical protein